MIVWIFLGLVLGFIARKLAPRAKEPSLIYCSASLARLSAVLRGNQDARTASIWMRMASPREGQAGWRSRPVG
jgi:hypothetical protein